MCVRPIISIYSHSVQNFVHVTRHNQTTDGNSAAWKLHTSWFKH